jgi:hypothetical protein
MIASVDAEKAFDKVWHSFVVKTLRKVEIEGNLIKGFYEKPYGLQDIECFLHKTRN